MPDERFEEHLRRPYNRDATPANGRSGAAGGAACGDVAGISVRVDGDRIAEVGFDASGCGATIAAGSAATTLTEGATLLDAARIDAQAIAAELGGLSPGKQHAAALVADALHRALGEAARHDAAHTESPDRVLVAMSGGVDSAVAALLEQRAGREVVAVTLELWRDPENDGERSCCSASAVRAARELAHGLGLPHLTLDLRDEFRAGVVEPWLAETAEGLTPNPCVRCNGRVRLDEMLALADRLGAAKLATGHYARTAPDGLLRAASDPAKDQSYMLAGLSKASLTRMSFPLGDLTKPEVRALARDAQLPVSDKPDSQDLCFLAGTRRDAFLARHGGLRERPGDLVDRQGRRLGRHRGHQTFTVGQRRGVTTGGSDEPLYVLATDARANTVTVGPRAALETREVALCDVRLHRDATAVDGVRLRSHAPVVPCALEHADTSDRATARLATPFAGAAPGQTAVLLAADVVVGVATIDRR